jgi:hypothetical protein
MKKTTLVFFCALIPSLFSGCTLLSSEADAGQKASTHGFSFVRTGNAAGVVTFSAALPRDWYLKVRWAYTYISIDTAPISESIVSDSLGNARFDFTTEAGDFTRLDQLYFAETVEGVIPVFEFHDQPFPASFDSEMALYLESTQDIPADNPRIVSIASGLRTDSMVGTAFRIVDFFDAFEYDYHLLDFAPESGAFEGPYHGEESIYRDALRVLDDHAGVCFEKAKLGAAIFRACGIPARIIHNCGHAWNEIYLPSDGWIPLDLSDPERQNAFSMPIQPWITPNFINTTAVGGAGAPPHLLDWDRELWGRLSYQGMHAASGPGTSVTDGLEDPAGFFNALKYIVVTPLDAPDGSEHPMRFFDASVPAYVFLMAGDVVLQLDGGAGIALDFTAPMSFDVAGTAMTFEFTRSGKYVLMKRL